MEKRIILAVFISIAILFIYNLYLYHLSKQLRPERVLPSSSIPSPSSAIKQVMSELIIPEEELIMKNGSIEIRLNNKGEIASLRLDKFKEKGSELGVEMVRGDSIRPLGLILANRRLLPSKFQSLGKKKEFTYELTQPYNIMIKKRVGINDDSYILNIEFVISNHSSKEVFIEDIGLTWTSMAKLSYDIGQLYQSGKKIENVSYRGSGRMGKVITFISPSPARDHKEEFILEGDIPWIAQQERYFLVTIIPEGGGKKAFFRKTKEILEMGLLIPKVLLPPLGNKSFSFKIYAGPKDYESLKSLYPGAERLTGLNSLSLLVLNTLRFIYRFTHNYGLAIILLSIIIKILLFPLTHISLRSMKEMQRLAPEIKRLKQRYKDDRERLNQEILALYKRYKVNPMSGCLPLLAQLPFLYAIFTTLKTAIDLRMAPFILWVNDLSDKDPFFILPILMGITMFIQQKMATIDPHQAKTMVFLPIVFTIMFMSFPSGLVLYWLSQNILSIIQEYLARRSK